MESSIVGLGFWGQNLVGRCRVRAMALHPGVARRPEAVAAFAARRGLRIVGDYAEALAAPDIDGIVLATPDRSHPQQVIEAARAGKPVLVEKPFALDRKSADDAIAAATQHKTLVAFAHNRRFLPAVADIRERIASDRLGRILHVEGNYSSNYGLRFKPGMARRPVGDDRRRHDWHGHPPGGLTR
jgi:predicted dehydrogenase